jgi:hypothetical protein
MTGFLRTLQLIILVLLTGMARAQQFLPATTAPGGALGSAIQSYHDFMGPQSLVYNGREPADYPQMKGHPYFVMEGVQKGSVVYDGILYQDLPLLYDLVKDHLIVFNYAGDQISLATEKIKEFSLPGHRFMQIAGLYYDLLCSGKVILLSRRIKTIEESIVDLQVVYTASEKDKYFIVRDGVSYSVGNLNGLLDLLKDKKKEIRQDLRKRKIRYRKDHERALVAATQYYNQSFH